MINPRIWLLFSHKNDTIAQIVWHLFLPIDLNAKTLQRRFGLIFRFQFLPTIKQNASIQIMMEYEENNRDCRHLISANIPIYHKIHFTDVFYWFVFVRRANSRRLFIFCPILAWFQIRSIISPCSPHYFNQSAKHLQTVKA